LGVGGHVFRDADSPNTVTILLGFGDAGQMRQYAASAELRAAMQRAGVQGRPEIRFLDEVDKASA
jgi:hypothetical protein